MLSARCPGPLGSCSPVSTVSALCCVCGVLGHSTPVHRCPGPVSCAVSAVYWATRLLLTGVPARCVVLRVRRPEPLGSCSPICPLAGLRSGVLSQATGLLFTVVPARCVVMRVRCPGPRGSCSPVWPLSALCCVCGVLGFVAPVHRYARSVRCVVCAVWWATWLLFTSVPAWWAKLRVCCPGQLGSCSALCPPGVLRCLCGVPLCSC